MAKLTHKKKTLRKKMRKTRKSRQRGGARGPRTGVLVNLDKIAAHDPNPYVLEVNPENNTKNVFGPSPSAVVAAASHQTWGHKAKKGIFGQSNPKVATDAPKGAMASAWRRITGKKKHAVALPQGSSTPVTAVGAHSNSANPAAGTGLAHGHRTVHNPLVPPPNANAASAPPLPGAVPEETT
uniref:Uncharacterized protein n=1 Tax=viral metagenome TaxID=1070528 RepID=A0A6C0JWY9_9ZZZZ